MSKTIGEVTEGFKVCQTISFSGLKQDWIVVMPSKYRKLLIFGKITPFERNSASVGAPVMSKTTGKVIEGHNVCETLSYSGFKQDLIVVIPSKYRKLLIFWKNDPLLREILPR